jgi:excisionase family DNA binding protein
MAKAKPKVPKLPPALAKLRQRKPPSSEALTITIDEAAERLRVGRNQMYEAVRRGDVPAIRVGKRWLVPTVAFNRLLACEPSQ